MSIKKILLLSAAFVFPLLFTTTTGTVNAADKSSANADMTWYTIQVGSSKEAEEVAKQLAILKTHGLDAISSYEAVEGKGMWYRVYVGRFATIQEAKAAASKLEAESIISGYWVKVLKAPERLPVSSEPDGVERAFAEKEEPTRQEVPQVSPAPEVTAPPAQLPAETKTTDIFAPSEKKVSKPAKDTPSKPTTTEEKTVSEKPIEPQVSPEPKVMAPPAQLPAETKTTDIIAPSEKKVSKPTEKTLSRTSKPGLKVDDRKPFSVALRLGAVFFPGLDEFTVNNTIIEWNFNKKYLIASVSPSFSFNKSFSLESSVEKTLNAKFDFWYATLGARYMLANSKSVWLFKLSPYIRAALAGGDMSWDDLPGSFDTGLGGELGIGTDVITIRPNLKLGMEMSYRSIKFDYNIPSDGSVTSSQNKIDFSGISLISFLNYYF